MVSLPFDYKETTPSRACWSSSVRGFFSLPSISSTQNHAYPIDIRGAAEILRAIRIAIPMTARNNAIGISSFQ